MQKTADTTTTPPDEDHISSSEANIRHTSNQLESRHNLYVVRDTYISIHSQDNSSRDGVDCPFPLREAAIAP